MRSALALVAMFLSTTVDLPARSSGGNGKSGGSDRAAASDSHESGEGGHSGSEGGSGGASASTSHAAASSGGAAQGAHANPSHPSGTAGERGSTRSGASHSAIPGRTGINRFGREADLSQPRISRPTNLAHQRSATKGNVITTRDGKPHEGNWSRNLPANRNRFDRKSQDRLRNWQGRKSNFAEACHRHNDHHRNHHGRDWWHHHCPVIVLVDWGFWGWDDGWWYPAWGYDPGYSYYEYDGPIYGSGELLPDEIVANVQSALQDLGYYLYEVDGIFGPITQEALAKFQRDRGIPVTGAIDPRTLGALDLV